MLINQNNQNILLLLVKDEFCEEYLRRLIGLAQEITSDWAANIIIAFPNYNEFEDGEAVISAKSEFITIRSSRYTVLIRHIPISTVRIFILK